MADAKGVPGSFRRRLRQELASWRTDGLVTEGQAKALSERYSLDSLTRESVRLAVYAVYIVGALLVAGGVVSFVAAHWDGIPAAVKVIAMVGAMLGSHATGFWLWKVRGDHEKLGHALVVLGTLIFGAGMGLFVQIFHLDTDAHEVCGAWAIGALAVGYALWSPPNAGVAVAASFVWFCGLDHAEPGAFPFYPFLALAAFMPFAYLVRSRAIFTLALLASGVAAMVASIHVHHYPPASLFFFVAAAAAVSSLWCSWGLLSESREATRPFSAPARFLGVALTAGLAFLVSFREVAEELTDYHHHYYYRFDADTDPVWMLPAGAFLVVSVVTWTLAVRRMVLAKELKPVDLGCLAALVLVLIGLAVGVLSGERMVVVVAAVAACLSLAGGLAWGGYVKGSRALIWTGVVLGVLALAPRFFEYSTGLLTKSVAFLAGGVALIAIGTRIEKFLAKRKVV